MGICATGECEYEMKGRDDGKRRREEVLGRGDRNIDVIYTH